MLKKTIRRVCWSCFVVALSFSVISQVLTGETKPTSTGIRTVDNVEGRVGHSIWSSFTRLTDFAEAASVDGGDDVDDDGSGDDGNDDDGNKDYGIKLKEVRTLTEADPAAYPNVPPNISKILQKAWTKALGGGIPGAIAGIVQVLLLMWLRTVINYQSRYGTNFSRALSILYKEGGIPRFYRGLGFALFQAPLSRFVATASNDGMLSLLSSLPATRHWGASLKTFFASFVVGIARLAMMPIDTAKTVLQVDSVEGFQSLMARVKKGDIGVLYQGAWATALSSSIGHYPWFTTFNALSSSLWLEQLVPMKLVRNAIIGLISSIVSDTCVNAFRVVKTTKQSMGAKHSLSYAETIQMIVASDGLSGLFGRGLRTRILANALQSIVFTVIWRGLAERWGKANADNNTNTLRKGSTHRTPSSINDTKENNNHGIDDDHHPPQHHVDQRP